MKPIKLIFTFLILIIFLSLQSLEAATTGFSFLKTGISPRAISMGDSYAMNKFEPSSTFYNPALLGLSTNLELQIVHKEWFQDSKTEYLGFATHINNLKLGIGINSFSIQNIELRTIPGPPEGTFTARNLVLSLAGAYQFKNITAGLSGKFLYEKIHIHEASGYAFDLGALYSYSDYLQISLSINNIGKMNPLYIQSSKLPINLRFGLSSSLKLGATKLSANPALQLLTIFSEKKNHIHGGLEIGYDNLVFFRLGAQSGYSTHNFSTGFGINYKFFTFDYAYLPLKYELGNSHSFSIKVTF